MNKTTLEKYWNQQFGAYKVGSQFKIKEFPSPLLSAHFGVSNLIEELPSSSTHELEPNEFFLGEFKAKEYTSLFNGEVLLSSLAQAKRNQEYLNLLSNGFSEDFTFLTKLFDFLENFNHQVLLFYKEQELIAAATLGLGQDCGVILNTVIKTSHRGKNISKIIFENISSYASKQGITQLCFWTKYQALLRYVEKIYLYRINHH